MFKKLIYFLVLFFCSIGFFLFFVKNPVDSSLKECPFCNPTVLKAQKFYEDDLAIALYTHKPIFPGHCLVIPKRHIERFEQLSDEEATQISRVIKKVNEAVTDVFGTSSYLLLQKNGRESGQTVPHIHIHYIPRKAGDGSILKFFLNMYITNMKKPIDPTELQQKVDLLKKAVEPHLYPQMSVCS